MPNENHHQQLSTPGTARGAAGRGKRRGLAYYELLATLTIAAALASLVLPQLSNRAKSSSRCLTLATMAAVRQAINEGYYQDVYETLPGPQDPARAAHPQLAYLYVNPATFAAAEGQPGLPIWTYDAALQRGWSGPYLTPSGRYIVDAGRQFTLHYGQTGDPAPLDAWGHPIVLQQPVAVAGGYSATDRRFARLVSAGPNGVIDTPRDVAQPTAAQTGDDLVLPLTVSP